MEKSGTISGNDSILFLNCPELCFVCNREVHGKGALLSMMNTAHSNTPFPTKLMQLLGDAFMVVILENDKICSRCVNLMNQSDKLEYDLKKTQNIIRNLLDEKYNLNEDDELSNSTDFMGSENEGSEERLDTFYDENLWDSSDNEATHDCRGINKSIENLEIRPKINGDRENTCDVTIKSEQMLSTDKILNNENSFISENCVPISETLFTEDSISLKEEHPTIESGCNGDKQIVQEFEEIEDSIEEKLSLEKDNDILASPSHKSKDTSSVNEPLMEAVSILPDDEPQQRSHDDNKLVFDFCNHVKEVQDILISSNNQETSKSNTDIVPELESINSAPVKTLSVGSKKPAIITSGKKNCRKQVIKEKPKDGIKKLRIILPKVSTIKEVMSPLPTVKNVGHSSTCNKILNKVSKYNPSVIPKVTVLKRPQEKKSSKEGILKKNQCILTKPEKLNLNVAPLTNDLHSKLSNINDQKGFVPSKNDENLIQEKYQCSFCPRSFKKRASLRYHEIGHTGNYTHYCEFCGNGFATKHQLEYHRRIHTKEQRYVCDICGKKFSSTGTYWIHKKWHENPYPYKCEDCGKLFRHSSPLAVHRRKHRGERPFECSVCHLTFDVKTTLTRHMFLHTKQFPFNCADCSKGFTTRSKYNDHLRRKHRVFVKKTSRDPKNYKMAVFNNVNEKKWLDSKSADVIENSENCKNQNEFEESELNNCQIEIILPPSSEISENTFSDISWLT